LGACSSISEPTAAQEIGAPPDTEKLLTGIKQGIADSHFEPPIEVTDPISARVNSSSPWLHQERKNGGIKADHLLGVFQGRLYQLAVLDHL
jgi:hypothetical protein